MSEIQFDVEGIEEELRKPFPEEDIEWRVQQAGYTRSNKIYALVIAYVTNRAIFDRLDSVVGIDNWQNIYKEISGGLLCGISIRINGEWITKYDGSDPSKKEPVKGMISGAHKRAGVPWGIGRYLYKVPVTFAKITEDENDNRGSFKEKDRTIRFYWKTPKLDKIFLP